MDRVLVLAAHTDDAEIGCGGTISKFLKKGCYVRVVVFAKDNPDLPEGTLEKEFNESMHRLCPVDGLYSTLYDYPMRKLNYVRQDILDLMFSEKEKYQPNMVFVPSRNDLHKDHLTISEEGVRAFKGITTLGYEMPWNNITFDTHAFIKLSGQDLDKKIYALHAYESQSHKSYLQNDYLRCLARTRGVQAGCEYAEAFEVIRWIMT